MSDAPRHVPGHSCPQCGAIYQQAGDSCAERFSALLALDHSRQEPWGSRHGSAFSAYTLQHPAGLSREALERCWTLLYRIWIAGDDPQYVARALRLHDEGVRARWSVPELPADAAAPRRFRVTIADLGSFDADSYPSRLESWCRATLEALGQPSLTA
jgi:hypothetical protein